MESIDFLEIGNNGHAIFPKMFTATLCLQELIVRLLLFWVSLLINRICLIIRICNVHNVMQIISHINGSA